MKKFINLSIVVSLFLIFTAVNTFSQQWTNEQKEVWAGVQKYWEISSTNNADGFLSFFDESYTGWSYQSKVPQNKSNTSKWIKNDFKNNKTVLYTLTPVSIWVKDDFAFVHYFYGQIEENVKSGKDKASQGKWTDILMKKNGKWMLVGDHGGRTTE